MSPSLCVFLEEEGGDVLPGGEEGVPNGVHVLDEEDAGGTEGCGREEGHHFLLVLLRNAEDGGEREGELGEEVVRVFAISDPVPAEETVGAERKSA